MSYIVSIRRPIQKREFLSLIQDEPRFRIDSQNEDCVVATHPMRKFVFFSIAITGMWLLLSGCGLLAPATTARSKAYLHVRPVISALEKFHHDRSVYPTNLVQLSPAYLEGDLKRFLEGSTDAGRVWYLDYERLHAHEYELWFRGVHHDAGYKNGKFIVRQ